jgi:hypothetical protein
MSSLIVVGLLFATLFAMAYITKRRFGVLGLALAAGSLLSANWADTLTPFIEQHGVTLVMPPLATVVQAGLTLAPPLLLMFGGPTYSKTLPRLAGSLAFAVLAVTFLVDSIGGSLQLDPTGQAAYRIVLDYRSLIIVVGLVAALVDILLTRRPKGKDKKRER